MKRADAGTSASTRQRILAPGVLKITAAALIWGSMGVLIRLANLPPVTIVFWRSVFTTTSIAAVLVVTRQVRGLLVRKHRALLPLTGVLLLTSMLGFARAVQLTTIANAILTVYTAPVIIALLAPVFLRERFERRTLLALALAIAGIGLIMTPQGLGVDGRQLLGVGFASICAVAYALLVLVLKRVVSEISVRVTAFYQSAVAVVLLLPFVAGKPLPPTPKVWAILLVLGTVHTALAGMLYLSGLRTVKAQDAGILAYVEPLSGAVYGMIFLAEPLTVWVLAGGLLIVAAGWVVIRATSLPEPSGLSG